jgi:RNA polymerase sigma-70 factor, ECF subfamily
MEHNEEIEYIKRVLDGETACFSIFLDRYARQIYTLIKQIVGSNEDAEELTQDTFVKAFRKLDNFRGDCKFSSWLYRIAYNTAISATRKKKFAYPAIEESTLNNIADEDVDKLLNSDEKEELLVKMEKAIGLLTHEEKGIISLYYTEERSTTEIAEILEMSQANVKIKLYRARKKLYALLTDGANMALT